MSDKPIIVIGSGVAGYTFVEEFRRHNTETPIIMITRDDGAMYSKPGLSTIFQLKRAPEAWVTASAAAMADRLKIDILTHTTVTAVHPTEQCIQIGDRKLAYAELILATGADAHRLQHQDLKIYHVNNLEEYRAFHQAIQGKKRILIIGSGLVGCEFAHDLSVGGYDVTVLSQETYPLARFVPPKIGHRLVEKLQSLKIHWKFQAKLSDIQTSDYDVILSAIGIFPAIQLAETAGIHTNRGVVVNEFLETSEPHVYAIGDAAEIRGQCYFYVQPAQLAAKALVKTLLGERTPVILPMMRVKVKTGTYPIIFAGVRDTTDHAWRFEEDETGITGKLFIRDTYAGLILTGAHTQKFNEIEKPSPMVSELA